MAPAVKPIYMGHYEDDLSSSTKWWNSYPVGKFNLFAKPRDTFGSYISSVFQAPRKMARSASCTNLTYIKEADVSETRRLSRAPSWSSLAPSHQLHQRDRVAERYLPTFRNYQPVTHGWLDRAYLPYKFVENYTYRERYEPYAPAFRRWTTPIDTESYLRGSQKYMDRYVADRTRFLDRASHYSYTPYDQDVPNRRFLRYCGLGSSVFVSHPMGLPKYRSASHDYRVYRVNERLVHYSDREARPYTYGYHGRDYSITP